MTLTIEQEGAVIHDLDEESVVIAADEVTLVNPRINGLWKDENRYGLKVARDRDGRPFVKTDVVGGEITGIWGKGVVGSFLRVTGTKFHDIGEDGIICDPEGYVDVLGCSFSCLGWDPDTKGQNGDFINREGKMLHSDAIQVVAGSWLRFKGNKFTVPHGEPHPDNQTLMASNSCIYVESDKWGDVSNLSILGNDFDGGLYTVRIRDERWGNHVKTARVNRNRFRRYYYGSHLFETELDIDVDTNNFDEASIYRP